MYIIRDNTGQDQLVQSLEEVANFVQLDPHEIAWALEEFGQCETDTHWVEVDESPVCGKVGAGLFASPQNSAPNPFMTP